MPLGCVAKHLQLGSFSYFPSSSRIFTHEERILLTHDLDFGELVAASGAKLPSVIIFRLRNMRPEQVNRYLQGIITQHQAAIEEGAIISVIKGHIRVRVLPVKAREINYDKSAS